MNNLWDNECEPSLQPVIDKQNGFTIQPPRLHAGDIENSFALCNAPLLGRLWQLLLLSSIGVLERPVLENLVGLNESVALRYKIAQGAPTDPVGGAV